MQNVNRKLEATGKKMQTLGKDLTVGFTAPIVAAGGLAVAKFADFEDQMAKVKAISGATGLQFKALSENARELGESTRFTASEVGSLQLNYSKLGFNPDEILAVTSATLDLALATGEDLAESATVAASTLRGFGLEAKEMQRVVDVMAASFSGSALDLEKFKVAMSVLAPVAKNANIEIEDAAGQLAVLTNAGIDASTAGTGLRNIYLDLAGTGQSLESALAQISNSTNKNSEAFKLFGKRGATVAAVLADNSKQAQQFGDDFRGAGGAAAAMAAIMDNTLRGSFAKFGSALEGAAISIGEVLAPTIRGLADNLSGLISVFSQLSPETKKFILVIAGFVAAIGPVVLIIGTFIRNLAVIIPLVKSFTAVLLANPITAFAAAIAVIGGSLLVASTRFKSLTNATQEFAKLNVVATDSIAKQKAELEKHLAVAKDDNLSKAERQKAIQKLNALSPEYLGGLKLETINTDDATTATNKYINALLTKAKVQAAQDKLVKVQSQMLDLQLGQNDAIKPDLWQQLKNQITSGGNSMLAASRNAQTLALNFNKENKELKSLEDQLVSFINQNENLIQSLNKVPPLLPDNNPGDGRAQVAVVPTIAPGLQDIPTPLTAILQQLPKQREQINEELMNFQLSLLDFEQQSAGILEGAAESFAAGFGNIIAGIAQGANPIKGLVVLILNTIGDLLQQLGKAAISIGITMTGIKKAFTSPLGAIAAGVAAIALGAIIKTFIPKDFAGSFANGGVVGGNSFTGDKLFARINSGEMVLNQKQQANLSGMLASGNGTNPVLLDGSFVVTGDQLRLILDRSDKRKSRIG